LDLSADKLFERRWALTLLEQVLSRLCDEQAEVGQGEAFEQLKESYWRADAERPTRNWRRVWAEAKAR
jgi:hypothetical protein